MSAVVMCHFHQAAGSAFPEATWSSVIQQNGPMLGLSNRSDWIQTFIFQVSSVIPDKLLRRSGRWEEAEISEHTWMENIFPYTYSQ